MVKSSTITDDHMQSNLSSLGFTEKESRVYTALLEFGNQPASIIAKKTGYPKSTVLFIFENLVQKGYVRKSHKGRSYYFYADPSDLEKTKRKNLNRQMKLLRKTIPLLKELKNPFSSPPKLTFFEGLDGCRKAYSLLLESKTEIFEFAAHRDLLKMGERFMNDFVKKRKHNKIFMNAISRNNKINREIQSRDKKEYRKLYLYPSALEDIFSSLAIFENKVLILNLFRDPFGILIENQEMTQTLKVLFKMTLIGIRKYK